MACSWHEPEPHLGYDAEIALAEYSVDCWPVCMLEGLPRWVVCSVFSRERSHSSSEKAAVWEHDLHSAVVGKVVTIRCVSRLLVTLGVPRHGRNIPNPSINCISQYTSTTQIWRVNPELEPCLLNLFIKLEIANPGLNHTARIFPINLEYFIFLPKSMTTDPGTRGEAPP